MLSSRSSSPGLTRTYLIRAADGLASMTASYAIPLLVLLTTNSTTLTGVAFVVQWVPRLVSFSFAGSLVDRWGAGRAFRTANLVRATVVAVAGGVLLALPATGTATTWVVMTFGAVAGLVAEVSFVAVETLGATAGRRPGERAHRVQAVQTGIDQGALLLGPLLGALVLLAGPPTLMAVIAALAVTAAAGTRGHGGPVDHRPVPSSLLTGWRTLRHIPALAWLVGGLAASNLSLGVLQAATPITVVQQFRRPAVDVGMMWSLAAVASLFAVWAAHRALSRWPVWPVGAAAAALSTAACLATAFVPGFRSYTVVVAVLMAADGVLTVVLRTLRGRLIPARAFGSTLAVTIILLLLPFPAAGILVAAVPAAGLPHLLLACAVVQGMVLGACFAGLRRHRAEGNPALSPVRGSGPAPARTAPADTQASDPAVPVDAP
ncbi:MFS transporter [Streptomyces sp. NPDC059568]|uniref:MFS transporter n=1 Tax=Streptomyces sp. NPDC059568 TaxID=3346868 RepID=UPI0036B9BA31